MWLMGDAVLEALLAFAVSLEAHLIAYPLDRYQVLMVSAASVNPLVGNMAMKKPFPHKKSGSHGETRFVDKYR